MYLLEIACFNEASALIAYENGADRIELCDDMEVGGITPSIAVFKKLRNIIKIPMYVMIRPRGGDFTYTTSEFMQMQAAIMQFKALGADGFVFGILTENYDIHVDQNKALVAIAHPLPCTFHRAFDLVLDRNKALHHIILCGFKNLLTSGLSSNVVEGKNTLQQLVRAAKGSIHIVVGGGLRSNNILAIKQHTLAQHFHSSAIVDDTGIASPIEISALKSWL